MAKNWQRNPISDKQVAFIKKLLEQKDVNADDTFQVEDALNSGTMTAGQASGLINDLLQRNNRPKPVAQRTDEVKEDGMYRTPGGIIYKVQKAVHGSGRLYAKRLLIDSIDEESFHIRFEYEAGAVKHLTPSMRMTLEQAKEFGALYGTCCVCGRTLTNEVSIEAGIGPVCAGRL